MVGWGWAIYWLRSELSPFQSLQQGNSWRWNLEEWLYEKKLLKQMLYFKICLALKFLHFIPSLRLNSHQLTRRASTSFSHGCIIESSSSWRSNYYFNARSECTAKHKNKASFDMIWLTFFGDDWKVIKT